MNGIFVQIAPADLIDRLTRLHLKSQQNSSPAVHAATLLEISQLEHAANLALPDAKTLQGLWGHLAEVNADLFSLAADIRLCEDRAEFGPAFVALVRAMIAAQENRSQIKDQISQLLATPTLQDTKH